MIEPPKLAVFLFVVTAHLAVLAFAFPDMRTTSVDAASQSGPSPSAAAELTVVDQASSAEGLATGSDTRKHDSDDGQNHQHENAYGHGAAPRGPAAPASGNSSATRAGHRSESESDGPIDSVPTLDQHQRQHGEDEHVQDHDHDGASKLVDPERIADNASAPQPPAADKPTGDAGKSSHVEKPDPGSLAAVTNPPSVKPLPSVADESHSEVPARPTPVQMILPEQPVAKPSVPNLKPVAKPTTPAKAPETPRASPVANAPKLAAPTSNRAGSGRMKNLRPIQKP